MIDLYRFGSLAELLLHSTQAFRSNIANIEANRDRETKRLTYGDFQKEALRLAALLQENRVGKGDRVAILMTNQAAWPISAASIFFSGAILVPLDYKLSPEEQIALLRHAQPKVLISEWSLYDRILRFDRHALDGIVSIVSEVPSGQDLHAPFIAWNQETDVSGRIEDLQRDDIACIVYSSGTGGRPKGCMLTHANYLSQAEALSHLYEFEDGDRFFSILPTNHAIDFMLGFLYPHCYGATVVHQRTLRPEFLRWTMKEYGITQMALVPMLLKTIQNRMQTNMSSLPAWKRNVLHGLMKLNEWATQRTPNYGLSRRLLSSVHKEFGGRLRYIFAGGAFVDPSIADFFYRLGIPVVIGYGLTEAGTVVTVNDCKPFRSDTVGKPLRSLELSIRKDADAKIGEVWVKGPTVMRGYFKDDSLTSETIVDGWLRTGDMGYLDASGHLHLVGRAKNMIVTEGGKNIYPEDIECHFERLSSTDEFCIFSSNYVWPNESLLSEKLILVVRPSPQANQMNILQDAKTFNRHLPDYKRLAGCLFFHQEFPRTASMKIKRQELALALQSQKSVDELFELL